MKNFDKVYEELRSKISSDFYFTPNEYKALKRGFMMFYEAGMIEMKKTCVDTLEDKMSNCNDNVPKTFYPSEKFKTAIKVVKEICVQ